MKNKDIHFIAATLVGNILEWYEFSLYGTLASLIASLFFPEHNAFIALTNTFGIFVIGHLTRPIGGALFGYLGDLYSRKTILISTLLLMGLSTGAIGLLPTYAQAGIFAPLMLVVLRLIQGLAVGGEYPGGIVVLVELFEKNNLQGFAGSLPFVGSMIGIFLGTFLASITTSQIGTTAMMQWGWRIPFLAGFFLAVLGLWVRLRLLDQKELEASFTQTKLERITPPHDIKNSSFLIFSMLALIGSSVSQGFLTIFFPTYLNRFLGFSFSNSLFWFQIISVVLIFVFPLSALIADRKQNHRKWLQFGFASILFFSIPVFFLCKLFPHFVIFFLMFYTFIVGITLGPLNGFLVQSLPRKFCYMIFGVSHGSVFSIFAGLAPIIFNTLCFFGGIAAPSYYLAFAALISLFAINFSQQFVMPLSKQFSSSKPVSISS